MKQLTYLLAILFLMSCHQEEGTDIKIDVSLHTKDNLTTPLVVKLTNNTQYAEEYLGTMSRNVDTEVLLLTDAQLYTVPAHGDQVEVLGHIDNLTTMINGKTVKGRFDIVKGEKGIGLKFVDGTSQADLIENLIQNGNKIVYTNPAGTSLTWDIQRPMDIEKSIKSALSKPKTEGRYFEGKVAAYLQEKGIEIKGFAVEVKDAKELAGDIDIITTDAMIEVKKSHNAWTSKKEQLKKYATPSDKYFFNPDRKKVILYIDEPLRPDQIKTIQSSIPNEAIIVNSLEELILILKSK